MVLILFFLKVDVDNLSAALASTEDYLNNGATALLSRVNNLRNHAFLVLRFRHSVVSNSPFVTISNMFGIALWEMYAGHIIHMVLAESVKGRSK